MEKTDPRYGAYVSILKEELRPAMGCTEPIAVAYAAAYARDLLGAMPERVVVEASGSIIKNVKSVIVPNTNHLKGIPAAALAGVVAGRASKLLEVISEVSDEDKARIKEALDTIPVTVEHVDSGHVFEVGIRLYRGDDRVYVQILDYHTNICRAEKNGEMLAGGSCSGITAGEIVTDRTLLSMEGIWDFITTADTDDFSDLLDTQIEYNMAIAEEGMKNDYGANIGKVLISMHGNSVRTRARAYAAAGSDARMNGCELPVVICSGSGNQGITASVPVIVYAKEVGATQEQLYRALALSDLVTIHQKTPIGRLSAYCGAVSAGAGAGAGIAYLCGGGYAHVIHTVVNAISIISGMVCDGAKASCAAKIAEAIDAGLIGYHMYINGQQFRGGDGLVKKGVENTINNIGKLASIGMKETNEEIIRLMVED